MPGTSSCADQLSTLDRLAYSDVKPVQVRIIGDKTISVVNHNQISVSIAIPLGIRHKTRVRRDHPVAVRTGNINRPV